MTNPLSSNQKKIQGKTSILIKTTKKKRVEIFCFVSQVTHPAVMQGYLVTILDQFVLIRHSETNACVILVTQAK